MSAASMKDGKHYKQVVIEYYDDLIAQVDAFAEEILEEIKDDEIFSEKINERRKRPKDECDDFFHYRNDERYTDPYTIQYTLDEPVTSSNNGVLVKEFVHNERLRAVNEFKRLQKQRLDELRLSKTKPSSVEEALFGGTQFGILVKIDEESNSIDAKRMKFRQLAVVVDFYLDPEDVEKIE
jgi:hypothetical protein